MTRLFFRIYLALGLVLLGCVALVVVTREPNARQPTLVPPPLAARQIREVAAATPEAPVEAAVQAARQLGLMPEVRTLDEMQLELGPAAMRRLEAGRPMPVSGGRQRPPSFAIRLSDRDTVILLGLPRPEAAEIDEGRAWGLLAVLLGGIAFGIYATLRPLRLQLEALADAARAFGRGTLAARAPVRADDAAGKLADTFNEMAARIERLVESRQELLLAVSHELRTPVARLRFAVEMLAEAEEQADRDARAEAIHGDLEQLDALIGELLAFTRVGAEGHPIQRAPVALAELLPERVRAARRLAPTKHVELLGAVDALPTVEADRRLLTRALDNLLSNAMRYSDGRVEVSVDASGGARSPVVIQVDDDGPGVPAADRRRIFEPMVRLDAARSRDTGGVGLGLALVERIARAHHGEVGVDVAPLGGARFRLSLSRSPAGDRDRDPADGISRSG